MTVGRWARRAQICRWAGCEVLGVLSQGCLHRFWVGQVDEAIHHKFYLDMLSLESLKNMQMEMVSGLLDIQNWFCFFFCLEEKEDSRSGAEFHLCTKAWTPIQSSFKFQVLTSPTEQYAYILPCLTASTVPILILSDCSLPK